jgi:hypothetical protein
MGILSTASTSISITKPQLYHRMWTAALFHCALELSQTHSCTTGCVEVWCGQALLTTVSTSISGPKLYPEMCCGVDGTFGHCDHKYFRSTAVPGDVLWCGLAFLVTVSTSISGLQLYPGIHCGVERH